MEYNSSVDGTIIPVGNWDADAVEAFLPVLECWDFYGEEGLRSDDVIFEDISVIDFDGESKTKFSKTLKNLDSMVREWIEKKPVEDGEEIHSLTAEQYKAFLKMMSEKKLSLDIEYDEYFEGGKEIHESGILESDGEKLTYRVYEDNGEDYDWNYVGKDCFNTAVKFFGSFVENPDYLRLRKWVRYFIKPSFDYAAMEDFAEDFASVPVEFYADFAEAVKENFGGIKYRQKDFALFVKRFKENFSPLKPSWDAFLNVMHLSFGFFDEAVEDRGRKLDNYSDFWELEYWDSEFAGVSLEEDDVFDDLDAFEDEENFELLTKYGSHEYSDEFEDDYDKFDKYDDYDGYGDDDDYY